MIKNKGFQILITLTSLFSISDALQQTTSNRRHFLVFSSSTFAGVASVTFPTHSNAAGSSVQSLNFSDSKSGIQWADAKIGSGQILQSGSVASIDYVLSTTGARYGSKIYSNSNSGAPYRWIIGDGTTIKGIEEAIVGNDDIPPMKPGGIRRVIIPPSLAYQTLGSANENCDVNSLGPVPPPPEAFEEFQRFKNIYCNPSRVYQPDVVMDIKLYGKRSAD